MKIKTIFEFVAGKEFLIIIIPSLPAHISSGKMTPFLGH
jgi:hypothetical protein